MKPQRIQRQRTKGWRMPEGAVYVGRPSPYGNPFPWDDQRATWMAVAFGYRADEFGRRTAAVALYRWWAQGGDAASFMGLIGSGERQSGGGEIEYTSGRVAPIDNVVNGFALTMFLREPLVIPPRPALEPLRGHDLACWCPLTDAAGRPVPCHADVLLELANPKETP